MICMDTSTEDVGGTLDVVSRMQHAVKERTFFRSVIPRKLMTRDLRRIRGTLLMSSCLEAILGEGLLIIQGFEKLRNGNILLRKNRLKLCTHLYDLWYWLFTFVGVVHIVSPISLVRKQLHMIVISHGRKQIGDVGALKKNTNGIIVQSIYICERTSIYTCKGSLFHSKHQLACFIHIHKIIAQ